MGNWRIWENDRQAIGGLVAFLVIFGTINVYSSSFVLGQTEFGDPLFFIKRHLISLIVGVLLLFIASRLDYHLLQGCSVVGFFVVLVALVLVFPLSPEINGARRWIPLGFFQLQPSELAKLVMIILEAAYLGNCLDRRVGVMLFNRPFFGALVMAVLVEREPDGMTAVIIAGVPIVMMLVSTLKKETKLLMMSGLALGGTVVCLLQPYRMQRIMSAFNPWKDMSNTGYQAVQSIAAIGSGGFWGTGLGVGISKYQYLPEAHTDFAFAILCQENGFKLVFLILLAFAAFAIFGARVAVRARDGMGMYLAAGITFLISGQSLVNLFMVSGWFPVVGVPLPFISYGGTSLVVTLVCVGILLNISRQSDEARRFAVMKASAPPAGKNARLRRVK